MCVGLGAASIVCPASCIWLPPFSRVMPAPTLRPLHHIVRMAGQLLDREGRAADSAGKTFLIAAMRHNQELFHASSYRSSR